MEKLIYVLAGATDALDGRLDRIAADVVPAARGVGAEQLALFLPDEFDAIGERAPDDEIDGRPVAEVMLDPRESMCARYWN